MVDVFFGLLLKVIVPMSWFVTNFISTLLLPPLILLLPGIAGCILWRRRLQLARMLIAVSLLLLWLSATPYFAESALQQLEQTPPFSGHVDNTVGAIVILGAGSYFSAPEYQGSDTVSAAALMRLRYGAKLQRDTRLPILVSGGKPLGNTLSEGEQMRAVLQNEFQVPVRWVENQSNNTWQNAQYSQRVLTQNGVKRIYLVTHAWHMPRAILAFRAAGLDVVPAPTAFTTHYQLDLLSFLPSAEGMRHSRIFMHEMMGMIWYRLQH